MSISSDTDDGDRRKKPECSIRIKQRLRAIGSQKQEWLDTEQGRGPRDGARRHSHADETCPGIKQPDWLVSWSLQTSSDPLINKTSTHF
ncbi:hypothetical protein J6590_004357 [Homalodisca vitripennis]|nr:hypothetical protein J6590_004357 [Homalodisca vitripennis]